MTVFTSRIKPIMSVLGKEIAITMSLLLGVSLLVFFIIYLAPGNPFDGSNNMDGESSSGFLSSYLSWLSAAITGDLGVSSRTGLSVTEEVANVIWSTLSITLCAIFFIIALAAPLGIYTARKGTNRYSIGWLILAYVFSALPIFWVGYLAVYVSIQVFDFFPLNIGFSRDDRPFLNFMLPVTVLVLGSGLLNEAVRVVRLEVARVFQEEYIRTAIAKGAKAWKHAYKEALVLPLTEFVTTKIPFMIGGAIIVEQIFSRPGLGRMAWQSAQDRDFALIMGITLISALLVRLASLINRFIYILINPRASHE